MGNLKMFNIIGTNKEHLGKIYFTEIGLEEYILTNMLLKKNKATINNDTIEIYNICPICDSSMVIIDDGLDCTNCKELQKTRRV